MKKVYIIATPSGRSIVSIRDDPRKAYYKNKTKARAGVKHEQKFWKVKLKIKQLMVSDKVYNQHY